MPPGPIAASAYDIVLAVHIMAVVLAFGWTFALPIMFAVAARRDPRGLALLHRIEWVVSRYLLNPALAVLLGAGIFLASDGHHWKQFFVQWGIGVIVVIGGLVGAVLMPAAKRAEQVVTRDLEGYTGGEFTGSAEYQALVRRISIVGTVASLLVLVTIAFMVIKP